VVNPFVLFFIFLGVEKDEGFYFFYTLFLGFLFYSEVFLLLSFILVYVVTGAKGYTLMAWIVGLLYDTDMVLLLLWVLLSKQ